MKNELYACAHVAEFPAQALLRLRPDLKSRPVAVLDGRAPQESVCAFNQHAQRCGISPGMTRLEAETISGLKLLSRSSECEAAANAVLRECAAAFSPRLEEASRGTSCAVILDIAGSERLFGPPAKLAERLRHSLADAGFRSSIAVSANYHTALLKAASSRGITVIPSGNEAAAIANLPLAALNLDEEPLITFSLWGIRTLGELAELRETELVTRLGPNARMWRDLARGAGAHLFQPVEAAFRLEEFVDFESPVEQLQSLLFVGARMIDSLVSRAAARAFSLAALSVDMRLERGGQHRCSLKPALPTTDQKFLLKLLQLEIAAHPPSKAVVALTITAQPGQSSKAQLGLFTPPVPEPSRLDVTLARIRAIVGEDYVGSPVLEDSHHPAGFHMAQFPGSGTAHTTMPHAYMSIRRIRPPLPVRVLVHEMSPTAFRDQSDRFEITAAYGPWRTNGCWWSTEQWDVEEWDVFATKNNNSSVACLLVHDRVQNEWRLEALYD